MSITHIQLQINMEDRTLLFTHMCPVTEFAVASHLNTANSCCHHVFLRHFRFQNILGTGNAAVSEYYNTCFALSEGNRHFLVDAGGGNRILKVLKDTGIPLEDNHDIFVTHEHVDHVLGIIWLIRIIGLLHEAFCLYSEADTFKPYEKHHSTVKEACQLAESLHIPNLLLYHTEETHLSERKKLYTEEGKRYFLGNLYVPDDLEIFEV